MHFHTQTNINIISNILKSMLLLLSLVCVLKKPFRKKKIKNNSLNSTKYINYLFLFLFLFLFFFFLIHEIDQPDTHLPKNITVPNDHKFKFLLSASGVQLYACVVPADTIPFFFTLFYLKKFT